MPKSLGKGNAQQTRLLLDRRLDSRLPSLKTLSTVSSFAMVCLFSSDHYDMLLGGPIAATGVAL